MAGVVYFLELVMKSVISKRLVKSQGIHFQLSNGHEIGYSTPAVTSPIVVVNLGRQQNVRLPE